MASHNYLTPFMGVSLCLQAAPYAFTSEFPDILRNQVVHHRLHKNTPLVNVLSQISPVHITPSYLPKVYFNINSPYTS
jgi:hypothetical protein